jgi:hypothetical protein
MATFSTTFFNGGVGPLEERQQQKTTHLRVWAGAQIMFTWLLEQADALGLARPGARILELGSGTGWMMLNVACHLPELNVTLSDQAEAVTNLKSNVERATQEHPALAGRVHVLDLNWDDVGSDPSLLGSSWDFIIGSDLLYSIETMHALSRAWSALLDTNAAPGTQSFYAHMPRRSRQVDAEWRQAFANHGLLLEPVPEWHGKDGAHGGTPASSATYTPAEGASDDENGDWLPNGGLFAQEDARARDDVTRERFQIFTIVGRARSRRDALSQSSFPPKEAPRS